MRGTHGSRGPEIPPPMDVFQVYPPVRVGQDYLPAPEKRGSECSVVLMEHVFGFSYGQPFVGKPCSRLWLLWRGLNNVGFALDQGPMFPRNASGRTCSSI